MTSAGSCEHSITQGRDGQEGSFCVECGSKVYEVDARPCNSCAHSRQLFDGWICRHHLMAIVPDMRVTYKISEGTCWTAKEIEAMSDQAGSKGISAERDAEIVREAMNDHAKHYWCLVRTLKARKKGWAELAELLGEGSTVAKAIWEKYINMELPERLALVSQPDIRALVKERDWLLSALARVVRLLRSSLPCIRNSDRGERHNVYDASEEALKELEPKLPAALRVGERGSR